MQFKNSSYFRTQSQNSCLQFTGTLSSSAEDQLFSIYFGKYLKLKMFQRYCTLILQVKNFLWVVSLLCAG